MASAGTEQVEENTTEGKDPAAESSGRGGHFSVNAEESFATFGIAHRFIFFAVLEGLYEDGVSSDDVNRMLKVEKGQSYDHFISHCPICTAVLQAMQVYASRADIGRMYKGINHRTTESTFGPGLAENVQSNLMSDDPEIRLKTMYQLVSTWFNRRLVRSNLSHEERATLVREIEAGKEEGMRKLQSFKKAGTTKQLAPAFVNVDSCAMCSAASKSDFQGFTPMDLPAGKPGPFTRK